jgi:hypothetical protein
LLATVNLETMKYFGIYQFLVDQFAGQDRERNLLVGFVKAENETDAINSFTDDDFKQGFLTAHECSEKDYERPDLIESIEKNKVELGVWA